jgi:hypothetical protein
MISSRLENQAMDSSNATSLKGYFIKGVKRFLAVTKAVISASQTFFGTQFSFNYTIKSNHPFSKTTVIISALAATNSLVLNAATRSREMVLSSVPKKLSRVPLEPEAIVDTASNEKYCHCATPPELVDLNFINKAIYLLLIFLSKGSRIFSSLAAYNGAINLCKTIVALVSSAEDPLESINQDPVKQSLIQIFGFICFSAQMLSFSMFQSTFLQEYLINWWFNPEKRNKQISDQGYLNILLAVAFFIIITSTTFFGIFSTESGFSNLNDSFFKPILQFEMPQIIIDMMVGFSAISLSSLTTTSVIPSTYHFLTNKKERGISKSLTTTGKLLMVSGIFDCLTSSYATTYSSIIKTSNLFNIDNYNIFLRTSMILSIAPTSFFYYFVYNTRTGLERFYSIDHPVENLNEPLMNNQIQIVIDSDKDELHPYHSNNSPFLPGGPSFYSASIDEKMSSFISDNLESVEDKTLKHP